MKEIGGFLDLDLRNKNNFKDNSIFFLNSGRNCLRLLLKALDIKQILIPNYICKVVNDALNKDSINIIPYEITEKFLPQIPNKYKNSYIVYVNYFGVCGEIIKEISDIYKNLIVDNTQSFFSKRYGIASFKSPRKFFGVPDGGILEVDVNIKSVVSDYYINLEQDISFERCNHLLKRIDLGANHSYYEYKENNIVIANLDIKKMSILTEKLLNNIDMDEIKIKRLLNFYYLKSLFDKGKSITYNVSKDDVPLYFPYITENISLRDYLINKKIYIPTIWPNCAEKNRFSQRIIPIPIDQRYSLDDMFEIYKEINNNDL